MEITGPGDIGLHDQDRVPHELAQLHMATSWLLHDAPAVSLRIRGIMKNKMYYEKYAHHGKDYVGAEKMALDYRIGQNEALNAIFRERHSSREFHNAPLQKDRLAAALCPGTRRFRKNIVSEKAYISTGPYPSAGGLYPVNVYIILPPEEGAECAKIFYYSTITSELSLVREVPAVPNLGFALNFGREKCVPFGAAILLTCSFSRSTTKYGMRGYRFSLLEAGHLAQNILLCCTAERLGATCWGGYADDQVHSLLRIDGVDESVVHCLLLGEDAGEAAQTPDINRIA